MPGLIEVDPAQHEVSALKGEPFLGIGRPDVCSLTSNMSGFPLRIQAFEGNKAETKTFLPSVEAFMATYDLSDVTVVADAGMISEANRRDLDVAGLSYVLGGKTKELPYPIWKWRADNPGVDYVHDQVWESSDPGDPAKGIRPSRTIANGQSLEFAHLAGEARLEMDGADGYDLPSLASAAEADPATTVLVAPIDQQ